MKTEKAYYTELGTMECAATVVSCEENDGNFVIVLDKTAIFPEGGGQPTDVGTIKPKNGKAVNVTSAYEKSDIVYHVCDKKLNVGDSVTVTAEKPRRIDHTQQHTGEHILSGLAKKMFDTANVGFHMAESYSTIDMDKELTDDQLNELEDRANAVVTDNVKIWAEIVDVEGLRNADLRKRAAGLEDKADSFRIVYVDNVDSCTCCGTHCKTSGEVGAIKITAHQKYKGGTRIWFLCGSRAILDYRNKQAIVDGIARRMSVSVDDVSDAVVRLGDENAKLKRELRIKTAKLAKFTANELVESAREVKGAKVIVSAFDGCDMSELRTIADEVGKLCGRAIALLISDDGEKIYYFLLCSGEKMPAITELIGAVNAAINGKGGGKGTFAQGSAAYKSKSELSDAISQLESYFAARCM